MNVLPITKKAQILSLLVEGMSVRSIERITGTHRDTIIRLLISAGEIARDVLDTQMQNLVIKRLQVDEIWTFVAKKEKRLKALDPEEFGDQYVFVALDPDTKLIPAFRVGKRNGQLARSFMMELKVRIRNIFQLSTDSFSAYRDAVDRVFGEDIHYAQIHKSYSTPPNVVNSAVRYSPGSICAIQIVPITGSPVKEHISTSLVERQNLTMRMSMRRFTRLSNAFSKRLRSLEAALALHFYWYNFIRIHRSLRVTPAMEAKITNHVWTWEELLTNCQQSQAA